MLAFDYIVVGGGSAGCVIAKRLAEKLPTAKIALIEAGKTDEGIEQILNVSAWSSLLGTEYDYDYAISEQLKGNSQIRHSRGKMLGGCSSHNSCIAFKAPDSDFLGWMDPQTAQANYQRVLTAIHLEKTEYNNPLVSAFLEAGKQFGLPEVDFLTPFDSGVGLLYLNKKGTRRQSSSVAYLHPLDKQPNNLTIFLETQATQLVLHNQRAVGVQTTEGLYLATTEVIVCAGAFDTPKLLMLSGIGPAQHLRAKGIETWVDLPGVGENLLDHPESVVTWHLNKAMPPETSQKYEAAAFIKSDSALSFADIMLHMGLEPFEMHTKPKGYASTNNGFSLTPNVTHAKSQGSVRLRSDDPSAPPVIDFQYYCDPDGYDLKTMIQGIRYARDIAKQPALAAWIEKELCPGPELVDDAALADYIKHTSNTVYHPAGTCKLGLDTDRLAVLNAEFKVRGIEGLRVADASVFPHMIGVNPNLTVMMIAERCARLIVQEAHRHLAETAQRPELILPI